MHIDGSNVLVPVGRIIETASFEVCAAGIKGNFVFTLFNLIAATGLIHAVKDMEEFLDIGFFGILFGYSNSDV